MRDSPLGKARLAGNFPAVELGVDGVAFALIPQAEHQRIGTLVHAAKPGIGRVGGVVPAQTAAEVGAARQQVGQQQLHGVGQKNIVGVQKGQVFAAACVHTGVARAGHTAVFGGDQAQLRVLCAKRLHNGGGVVGGAVVDNDDLDRLPGLRQRRFHRAPDKGGGVVGGDDNADQRCTHSRFSLGR